MINQNSILLLALAAFLCGCASLSEDRLADEVSAVVERSAGVRPSRRPDDDARLAVVLSTQLAGGVTADRAVDIALLASPDIQVTFAKLGLARADFLQQANPADPVVGWSRRTVRGETGSQVEWSVLSSLADLLTLPSRRRAATGALEAARLMAADQLLGQIAAVRAAWLEAVTAERVATMAAQRNDLQQLEAELVERYVKAGNLPPHVLAEARLELADNQKVHAEAAEARVTTRLQLARLMGLPADTGDWQLSGELAPLPVDDGALAELEASALENRLDVQAAKRQVQSRLAAASNARQRRVLPELTAGYSRERETDGAVLRGPELEWQIPLFSAAELTLAGSRAELSLALREAQSTALDAVRAVRAASERVSQARSALLRVRDIALPAASEAAAARSKEFFFMLIGPFEAMQARAAAMTAEIELHTAAKDYWLARLDLSRAAALPLQAVRESGPAVTEAAP